MEILELDAHVREGRKKRGARAVRQRGGVPGILYGPNRQPLKLFMEAKEFSARIAKVEGSHLVKWKESVPEIGGRLALVKGVQIHPVSGLAMHCDFYEVDENSTIRVMIPLHFVGRAAGVELGGILQPLVRELEVVCLPTKIPDFLEIDVSKLGIHEAVHVLEIHLPEGVQSTSEGNEAIVTILPPTVEEAKAPTATATPGADSLSVSGVASEKKAASK